MKVRKESIGTFMPLLSDAYRKSEKVKVSIFSFVYKEKKFGRMDRLADKQ